MVRDKGRRIRYEGGELRFERGGVREVGLGRRG